MLVRVIRRRYFYRLPFWQLYAPTRRPGFIHSEQSPVNRTMNCVFAYLIQTGCIDRDLVEYFANDETLYENAVHHNAVFAAQMKTVRQSTPASAVRKEAAAFA